MADPPDFADDPPAWKVLSREYLSRKFWYTVRVDKVQLPSGHVIDEYWVNEYRPWVNTVAVTPDDQLVLVRQYRHGLEKVHWEIPAGTTEPGEDDLEAAAKRELLEETGYGGGRWSLLTTLSANPALQDNLTTTFLAEGVVPTAKAALDDNEDLRVRLVPLADVERLIDEGGFVQALHVAPLLKYLLKRSATGSARGDRR
ncbi:MAG TPA: NUDIX hydrolase [Polyangia bacterium]|nr:NUDIX hydrolase [Polyangia bacterium]